MRPDRQITILNYLMNFINRHFLKIFVFFAVILTCMFVLFYHVRLEMQIQVINNPTFVGEVVGKESLNHFSVLGIPIRRQLHIVGEYVEDDVVIQVNRTFRVSRYWYDKFNVGDLICHCNSDPRYVIGVNVEERVHYVSFMFYRRRNCFCHN